MTSVTQNLYNYHKTTPQYAHRIRIRRPHADKPCIKLFIFNIMPQSKHLSRGSPTIAPETQTTRFVVVKTIFLIRYCLYCFFLTLEPTIHYVAGKGIKKPDPATISR